MCIYIYMYHDDDDDDDDDDVIWYMIFDIWYMIFDIWYMIFDIWYMLCDIWYMIYDIWYMRYDIMYYVSISIPDISRLKSCEVGRLTCLDPQRWKASTLKAVTLVVQAQNRRRRGCAGEQEITWDLTNSHKYDIIVCESCHLSCAYLDMLLGFSRGIFAMYQSCVNPQSPLADCMLDRRSLKI